MPAPRDLSIHIGLVRAVNLAGRNRLAMADLRSLLERLGFQDVTTVLQSGNVLFRSGGRTSARLEQALEKAALERLGLKTDFFVRTARDWRGIIADNPFPRKAEGDPGHLLVMFLKEPPDRTQVTALQKAITGREVVRAKGRHAYVVYPDGVGRSRLTSVLIERVLGTRGTARNWNTVMRLGALADP